MVGVGGFLEVLLQNRANDTITSHLEISLYVHITIIYIYLTIQGRTIIIRAKTNAFKVISEVTSTLMVKEIIAYYGLNIKLRDLGWVYNEF